MERVSSAENVRGISGKKIFWGILSFFGVAVILFFGLIPLLKLAGSIAIILVIAFFSLVVLYLVFKVLWKVFTVLLGGIAILFAIVALVWIIELF